MRRKRWKRECDRECEKMKNRIPAASAVRQAPPTGSDHAVCAASGKDRMQTIRRLTLLAGFTFVDTHANVGYGAA
jgi:hypothetical protein